MLEYLVALALFSSHYHDGQGSRLYRLSCLSREYLLRWFQIRDPEEWMSQWFISPRCKDRAMIIYRQFEEKYA